MFATQQYMDMTPDPARKRIREEDEDLGTGISSFSEHRNKRLQSLPLRTSPRASQQPLPSALSPPQPNSHFAAWPSPSTAASAQDAEMDMTDDLPANSPPLHSQAAAARLRAEGDADNASGRLPTPIQPSFAAQVRGQQCEWAGPGPTVSPNGIVNLGHHVTGLADQHNTPRSLTSDGNWHNVHSNRRLPSPISEAEDPASNGVSMSEDGMQHQLPGHSEHLCMTPEQVPQHHYMEHPNANMDIEAMHASHSTESDGDAASPSPGRRGQGHMRSKHTINNWTWQPGMKKSFSIGYRADCEKCRLKVPGHFNHIIIS
jgi:hypothetical protein